MSDFQELPLGTGVWHLPQRYDLSTLAYIGGGQFGQVVSVLDTFTQSMVAIKKFTRPFENSEHAKRTYREIKILRHLNGGPHNNVLQLIDVFTPQMDIATLTDIYMVTELAESNLREVINHNDLSEAHIRLLMYRLLVGLKYIHSSGVIHRDLKPENIALWSDCSLRIIDMGLAKWGHSPKDTPYVQTRWYRAPEVVTLCDYDDRSDMWSFGCILAECFTHTVTFPGVDTVSQFVQIFEKRGTPPASLLDKVPSDAIRSFMRSLGHRKSTPMSKFVPNASPVAIDLLEKLLCYDPAARLSAEAALEHPFFAESHNPECEPTCIKFDASFEPEERTVDGWKELILAEILSIQAVPPMLSLEGQFFPELADTPADLAAMSLEDPTAFAFPTLPDALVPAGIVGDGLGITPEFMDPEQAAQYAAQKAALADPNFDPSAAYPGLSNPFQ